MTVAVDASSKERECVGMALGTWLCVTGLVSRQAWLINPLKWMGVTYVAFRSMLIPKVVSLGPWVG